LRILLQGKERGGGNWEIHALNPKMIGRRDLARKGRRKKPSVACGEEGEKKRGVVTLS